MKSESKENLKIKLKEFKERVERFRDNHTKAGIIAANVISGTRLAGGFLLPVVDNNFNNFETSLYLGGLFATDALDGGIARFFKAQTVGGEVLDIASDKVAGLIAMLLIAKENPCMYLPITIEFLIASTNLSGYLDNKNVETSYTGKAKTVILGASIILGFIALGGISGENYIPLIQDNCETILNNIPYIITAFSVPTLYEYIQNLKDQKLMKPIKITKEKRNIKEIMKDLFNPKFKAQYKNEAKRRILYKS